MVLVAAPAAAAAASVPPHVTVMTAYGYDAAAQHAWSTFGKGFNLTELIEGYERYKFPSLYRIDCVGCWSLWQQGTGFAAGAICHDSAPQSYRLCSKAKGDPSDWDTQTLAMLELARPHLLSGALLGVFLGDELTPQGLPFADLVKWIALVRGVLLRVEEEAGDGRNLTLYYCSSTFSSTWPQIPHNLTLFSLDDYHPAWMYPDLWVRPAYERFVFPKLGPDTKLIVTPPTFGSDRDCTAGPPSVWCTNQTYDQWVQLNLGNLSYYTAWAAEDQRIIGFDPWRLVGAFDNSSYRLGLLDMPEVLSAYQKLGRDVRKNANGPNTSTAVVNHATSMP